MSGYGDMLCMNQSCDEDNEYDQLEELLTTYYNHIWDGDSKQDWKAVLSIISICEAIICWIEIDHPHIDEVVIQSDNARCYLNVLLLYRLMLISNNCKNASIVKVIHSETQDGKYSINAHFAVAIAHIMQYVNEGNNVILPIQLTSVLSYNKQLNNSIAKLLSISSQQPRCIQ